MKQSRGVHLPCDRHLSHLGCLILLAGIMMLVASPLVAQTNDTTIYRLNETSTFQRGCFPPCACPVLESDSVRGTFRLTFVGSDPLFNYYSVDEVDWAVVLPKGKVRVTGFGTYQVGGEFAVQQQLVLYLKVGDNPTARFYSGWVPVEVKFPRITITISINGQFCFDTVIGVDAAPVPMK